MTAFLTGAGVAILLSLATFYTYDIAAVTEVEKTNDRATELIDPRRPAAEEGDAKAFKQ
ncbi:hypothetical protein [Brevirhabdus sp.]|uniref:hypothetical protein n=1 Tax=Brevirhabdus sp. TaxID=2004514 RepID=UPI0040592E4F